MAAFLLGLGLVTAAGFLLTSFARESDSLRFESRVDDVLSRIIRQVDQHIALLDGTAALFHVSPNRPDKTAFDEYVTRLRIEERFPGLLGLGFADRVDARDAGGLAAEYAAIYSAFAIWPSPIEDVAFPVIFVQPPNERNRSALGFDMYSDPIRREAMDRARDLGRPAATRMVSAPGGQPDGPRFNIFAPYYADPPGGGDAAGAAAGPPAIQGFVYATFSTQQFFEAATSLSPLFTVAVAVYDDSTPPNLLYSSDPAALRPIEAQYRVRRTVGVAGERWNLQFVALPEFVGDSPLRLIPVVITLGVLLSAAAALLAFQQVRAREAAEREADVRRRSEEEKDLLLQEMGHRLKNSLARVQAIARQGARSSTSVEGFVTTFTGRLDALSATQDLLTRSRHQQAELHDVLRAEITPVLGQEGESFKLDGPSVTLGPRQVLSLGLTFHELATNAMKYGGVTEPGGFLDVRWTAVQTAEGVALTLDWEERGATSGTVPETTGFGSRLVTATIVEELGGTIDRAFEKDGFRCRLAVVLKPEAQ